MLDKNKKVEDQKKIKQKVYLKRNSSKKVYEKKIVKSQFFIKSALTPEEEAELYRNIRFLVGKFVNHLMISGKKEVAERLFMETLLHIHKKEKKRAILVFLKALENTKPTIDVRSVRRGGASYQIPVPLKNERSLSMSIKWLIEVARKKGGNLALNLCNCLLEASKNQGDAVKKRDALHSIGLKNRSLTHFRWF